MKLSQRELRRVVQEAVRAKLEEGTVVDEQVSEWMSPAVAMAIANNLGRADRRQISRTAANLVIEYAGGDDEVMRPVRYEDVEHYAEQIAEGVMKDLNLRRVVQDVARAMLEELMEPSR